MAPDSFIPSARFYRFAPIDRLSVGYILGQEKYFGVPLLCFLISVQDFYVENQLIYTCNRYLLTNLQNSINTICYVMQ